MITLEDFKKLNLVAGTITRVEDHPNADRLYLLTINLGEEERVLVAGIKGAYAAEDLIGRQVVVVENLAPATIRGVESRGMILACRDGSTLALVTTEKPVAAGTPVS